MAARCGCPAAVRVVAFAAWACAFAAGDGAPSASPSRLPTGMPTPLPSAQPSASPAPSATPARSKDDDDGDAEMQLYFVVGGVALFLLVWAFFLVRLSKCQPPPEPPPPLEKAPPRKKPAAVELAPPPEDVGDTPPPDAEAPPEVEEEKRECVDDAEARLDGDPDFAAQMSSAVSDAMGSVMQPQMDFSVPMPALVNRHVPAGRGDGGRSAGDRDVGLAAALFCSSPDLDRAFCRTQDSAGE